MEGPTKGPLPLAFQRTMLPLIEELIKPKSLKNDLFFALLLVLMKDNDFVLLNGNSEESKDIKEYIKEIKDQDAKQLEATHTMFGVKDMHVKIIVTFLNDVALINGTISELPTETYSLCLPINHYISMLSNLEVPTFTNLDTLASLFIEKIIRPIKCAILNHHNSPSANFSGLPEDIIHEIVLKLTLRDVLSVSESCRRMYYAIKEDGLWLRLYKRDFGVEKNFNGKDWMSAYKSAYVLNTVTKAMERTMNDERFRDMVTYSDYQGSTARWEVIL